MLYNRVGRGARRLRQRLRRCSAARVRSLTATLAGRFPRPPRSSVHNFTLSTTTSRIRIRLVTTGRRSGASGSAAGDQRGRRDVRRSRLALQRLRGFPRAGAGVREVVDEACVRVCEGQFLDIHSRPGRRDHERYRAMAAKKNRCALRRGAQGAALLRPTTGPSATPRALRDEFGQGSRARRRARIGAYDGAHGKVEMNDLTKRKKTCLSVGFERAQGRTRASSGLFAPAPAFQREVEQRSRDSRRAGYARSSKLRSQSTAVARSRHFGIARLRLPRAARTP